MTGPENETMTDPTAGPTPVADPPPVPALQDRYWAGNRCFGCGGENPDGLHLKSFVDGDDLVATWVPDARYQGPPGVVNGGVMAVPMDCHGTWTAMRAFATAAGASEPLPAVTAGYSVRLLAPTPVEVPVQLRAEVRGVEGRKAKVRVTATSAGTTTASFEGTFVRVPAPADG